MLTKADADKILKANLINLLKRVNAGKTLTAADRALVAAAAAGLPTDVPASVTNKAQLAEALKESRQTLNNWTKDPTFPKPDRAGRYDVAACINWKAQSGGGQDKAPSILSEKARNLQLRNCILEDKLKQSRRLLLAVEEVKRDFTRSVFACKSKFLAIPGNLCQKLALMKEAIAIQEVLRASIIEALGEMEKSEWSKMECPQCKTEIKP
ncbi:MAG: hypothetical protein JWM68_2507 [Verrucomicrobiales bacterium]|nr:hypothetical protein [Verrucomicrobiales bacterium]